MPKAIARVMPFVLLLTAVSVQAAEPQGTTLSLKAIPSFLKRVFVPVVAGTANTFAIETAPVEQVLETPPGFVTEPLPNGGMRITAPAGEAAGYMRVRAGGRELTLTLVTLVPYNSMRGGKIEGYQVGEYAAPRKGSEKPKGFIRLTDAVDELWVSDHYRLRDFQCKLDGTSKFLVVRTEALIKLELLQHELETRHGLDFSRFTIMSGYRTPYYNSKIGNETGYSRHLYGDAMDIYIDDNGDGRMDDVNRDRRVDSKDAKFLFGIAEQLDNSKEWGWLKGGAGVYHANAAHGPYLHVDARGYVARWGV